jgi:AbrB family looped-hinge helix DNA binding protein
MNNTLVKVQNKGQVTIPSRLRKQAGIMEGDMVEAIFQRGHIVLTPKAVIDRSVFPNADKDYTPAQRSVINARLAKSAEDIRKGRTYGPFNTVDEMIASLESELKKRTIKRKPKRSR